MAPFTGFSEAGSREGVLLPEEFFNAILPALDNPTEIKLALYVFHMLSEREGAFRYLVHRDLLTELESGALPIFPEPAGDEALSKTLEALIACGMLVSASVELGEGEQALYFLNNSRGRAAISAIQAGEWRMTGDPLAPVQVDHSRPNIYRLYEENIGPLSPIIADALRDAEDTYPTYWIEKAIQLAVTNNARNWRYVEAILDRWQREGPDERKDRRDTEKDRRRYSSWEDAD